MVSSNLLFWASSSTMRMVAAGVDMEPALSNRGRLSLLCAVHGGIRRRDERVGVLRIRRIDRDADTGPDLDSQFLLAELERHGEGSADLTGDAFRLFAPGGEQDHREFVAADAGDRVGFAYLEPDPRRDGFQQLVAGGVPKGVVYRLEPVQVEIQQGERARVAFRQSDRLLQAVVEQQ